MKKDDLVKVIRAIVRQELKKELPAALAQMFAQLAGGNQPVIHSINTVRPIGPSKSKPVPKQEEPKEAPEKTEEIDEMATLKAQLQEMFQGGGEATARRAQPTQQAAPAAAAPQSKQYTKNSVLNEILNQTRPFNQNERMAMRVGGGSAVAPGVAMAAASFAPQSAPVAAATGVGEMMSGEELGFMNKIPGMPGADQPMLASLPTGAQPPVRDGQEGGSAPLESMGEISALDIRNHPALPDSIKGILNRDYRSLVKAMDKKKH